jgi:hypothetical protein
MADEKQTLAIGKGKPGPGRKAGVPNRTTTALKDAILAAAAKHGHDGSGQDGLEGYLLKVATEDLKAFAGLLGKVLPLQIDAKGGLHIHLGDQVRKL